MSEVVMHRVDDRLIHGQVIVGWVGLRNANAIWIVDDFVAKNSMMLNIFKFAAPPGIKLIAMTVDEASERLKKLDEGNDRILLIAKVPQTLVRLKEMGYMADDVNLEPWLTNQFCASRSQTELTPEEAEAAELLYQAGAHVWILLVPHGGQKLLSGKTPGRNSAIPSFLSLFSKKLFLGQLQDKPIDPGLA